MTCSRCSAPCQGGLCRQCEVELAHEDQADALARDDDAEGDDE